MGKERARSAVESGAAVAMVHDIERERAEVVARDHPGCIVVERAVDVVRSHPDALFVCTPPSARGPIELEAVAMAVPFMVEKPIGVSAQQAAPIRDALKIRSLVSAVGYMNRCRTSVEHARQILADKRVLAISGYWVGRKYQVPWWLRSTDSGGPVNEQATHLIDLCRFLCGEIVEVTATLGGIIEKTDAHLSAALLLRFQNGSAGTLFYSCEAKDKQIAIRIITPDGGLDFTGWDLRMTTNTIDDRGIVSNDSEDIFVLETSRFLKSVVANDPSGVACSFEDAWRTQRVVDRIRQTEATQATAAV
jgi:predicted dehydrogenase